MLIAVAAFCWKAVEFKRVLRRLCRKDLAFKAQAIFHHKLNQVRQVYTESHELFMTGEEYTEWFL